ncbi:CDP-alcohol phosphatidyltransferase family protein [Flavobacterium sp.]|uniref:CDP-alcohol phosphatidyltransferase family protein n=1 Tax=Flavobacterium sp. TaxID=239 RepID=UPI002603CC8F|nr:CDP-alcohol phosphatidyltransferase family protein [Flavobacterium sp.]
MHIQKHIPNIITLLNLFCGCIALVFAFQLEFELAFYFVCLGIFFDFFDGFFARMFKVQSELGLQLDSLADMVTSGVVPGVVMFQMLLKSFGEEKVINVSSWDNTVMILPFLGFIITLGACFRLANFNIDTRQTDSFIGLPTPANALFILSLPLVLMHSDIEFMRNALLNHAVLLAITLLSAFVMNAEIPLFSLKVKNFTFKKNALQILFLASSVLFILMFKYLGIPLIILFYVILSVFNNAFTKK